MEQACHFCGTSSKIVSVVSQDDVAPHSPPRIKLSETYLLSISCLDVWIPYTARARGSQMGMLAAPFLFAGIHIDAALRVNLICIEDCHMDGTARGGGGART